MSSHHFVKEGQEPALFIAESISFDSVQSLLEWAPLVLVLDTALDEVLSWGIKIDVVISKRDHLKIAGEKVSSQLPVTILSYEEKENAIQIGLEYLVEKQQGGVNLLSKAGNEVFSLAEEFAGTLIIVLLNETIRWSFNSTQRYKKWLASKSLINIRNTKEMQEFSVHGLLPLQEERYQVHKDDLVIIESQNPFWVGEYYDN